MKLRDLFLMLMCFCISLGYTNAQVTTSPASPVDSESVLITFDASLGSQGLMDYTGDIYAHTGVITDQSTSSSDWKYVKAGWSENIEACKMTSLGDNLYQLEITPSIIDFYGVADGETIEQMAFVFRNSDGSLEGKTSSGGDIFVNVSTLNLTVSIQEPVDYAVYASGDSVDVQITATNATAISYYVNGSLMESVESDTLITSFTAGDAGKHTLVATASADGSSVNDTIDFYVRGEVDTVAMSDNLKRGVNRIDEETVTFVLYAPDKSFVHVIGDFNNWEPNDDYLMKLDDDGVHFWLTVSGLDANTEYAYQYYIDGDIRVADPYTNKTCDEYDVYIDEDVYPDLKDYPDEFTSYPTAVFTINEDEYQWTVTDFTNPDISELVIYELHVRDFTDSGAIKTVTDSINYFIDLGVTAIELMPFNEFEGNDSWGYNPSFYFAPDKAYGTPNDYKEFIDVCHENGIAVLMDMVLNHSYGQSPFARMYLDEDGNPADNNPWYNPTSNFLNPDAQWGYDFNHESEDTQELVDSICSFWMSEYKIDGFRFDFTKGFSNTIYDEDSWGSAYDADRIVILERMADEIWARKSDAIISFEHLSDNDEETELANYGILLWGNHNYAFNEATMGYYNNSDLSWMSYVNRGWDEAHIVNYMESHDEERIMYKNLTYGDSEGDYDVTELETALERTQAAAVFLISVPGPKLIWQFGELGYDYSINTCTDGSVDEDGGCRTSSKPAGWEYYGNEYRMALFDVYSEIINLKKKEPVFTTDDFSMSVSGAAKRIELNYTDSDVRLIGNFDLVEQSIQPNFSSTGVWYNHFAGDSITVTDMDAYYTLDAGQFALFSQKKLEGFIPSTGIGDPTYFEDAFIAPNPTSNQVTIYSGDNLLVQVKITSLTGIELYNEKVATTELQVNVGSFPTGIYLVHLIGDDDGYKVFKLLKQ